MSAFLQSGRSDTPKSGKTKVRFRPEADIVANEDFATEELIIRFVCSELGRVKLLYAAPEALIHGRVLPQTRYP